MFYFSKASSKGCFDERPNEQMFFFAKRVEKIYFDYQTKFFLNNLASLRTNVQLAMANWPTSAERENKQMFGRCKPKWGTDEQPNKCSCPTNKETPERVEGQKNKQMFARTNKWTNVRIKDFLQFDFIKRIWFCQNELRNEQMFCD